MSEKNKVMKAVADMPTWQKMLAGVAVVATGGVALAAVANGGLVVAVGEVLVIAGPAATAWAAKR